MSPRVIVPLLNVLADLHAWGRQGGTWWALVSWSIYGNTSHGNDWLYLSGWVPAAGLIPSADPSQQRLYAAIERFELPTDGTAWPTPAATTGRTWRHYGPITAHPPAPDGISVIPTQH